MNRLNCTVLVFLLLLTTQTSIFGQGEDIALKDTLNLKVKDTPPPKIPKRFFPTAIENLGTNILINRIDADLRNVHWAKVTPANWKKNLQTGFEADYDHFATNWLGHPMHGAFFYNFARSNGYNFWESIPFTLGGSLMWEFFGETYAASEIDVLTTTYGGIYLGEMTHRFSKVIKNRVKNKFLKYTAMTILNPADRLNSLFYKDKGPVTASEDPIIRGRLSAGSSFPDGDIDGSSFVPRGYLSFTMIYGDLFEEQQKKYRPFDYFVFNTWANFTFKGKDSVYFNISSYAPLFLKRLNENAALSVSQHYDYIYNDIYKIGSMAITGDYSQRYDLNKHNRMMFSLKGGLILFGSSQSEIVEHIYQSTDPEFERDYVYGNGFTGQLELAMRTEKFGSLTGNINKWLIYTDRDAKGTENLTLMVLEYNYPIWKKLAFGLQTNYYKRLAKYRDYKEFARIKKDYYEFKTMINFTF